MSADLENVMKPMAAVPEKRARSARLASQGYNFGSRKTRTGAFLLKVLPPLFGLGLLLWPILATNNSAIPSPMVTWEAAVKLFADPL